MIRWISPMMLGFTLVTVAQAAPPESTSVGTDTSIARPDSALTNVFRSEMARIEIRKPAAWYFADLESMMEHRASVKLKDEDFQKALTTMASAPLVAAMKYEEPYESLNPSFQVLVRPAATLEGKSGVEILSMIQGGLANAFENFKVVQPVSEIKVGGRLGGRLVATYTVATQDGLEFPTRSTLVLIPRGKVIYQIGFSGPPEGPDKLTGEIDEILASVKWLE
ncbi:MAG TPA: hypothetical protein VFP10_13295 [Candidatus Eisenbacteria bacterium]|nr:hypothetical protein [Candidatus Eisenbacteria bacterium]